MLHQILFNIGLYIHWRGRYDYKSEHNVIFLDIHNTQNPSMQAKLADHIDVRCGGVRGQIEQNIGNFRAKSLESTGKSFGIFGQNHNYRYFFG